MEYTSLVNKGIAQLMPYRIGKPLELVKSEMGVKNLIRLNAGESSYGVSRKVREVIENFSKKVAFYPDPNAYYLKNALFEVFKYKANNIVVGADVEELLSLIMRAFINEDSEVIVPRLSCIAHERAVVVSGARLIASAVKDDWTPDLDDILLRINDRTRMILLANPTIPIGGFTLISDIVNFMESVPPQVLVVVDEEYIEFLGDGVRDSYKEIKQYPNLIVLRSFSHVYGLASMPIGYMLCTEEICGILNTLRNPHNVSQLAMDCAVAALADQNFKNKVLSFYKVERTRYQDFCNYYGIGFLDTITNSITLNLGSRADYYYHCFMRLGIFTKHLNCLDLPTMINVTLGNAYQTDYMLKRMEQFILDDRQRQMNLSPVRKKRKTATDKTESMNDA